MSGSGKSTRILLLYILASSIHKCFSQELRRNVQENKDVKLNWTIPKISEVTEIELIFNNTIIARHVLSLGQNNTTKILNSTIKNLIIKIYPSNTVDVCIENVTANNSGKYSLRYRSFGVKNNMTAYWLHVKIETVSKNSGRTEKDKEPLKYPDLWEVAVGVGSVIGFVAVICILSHCILVHKRQVALKGAERVRSCVNNDDRRLLLTTDNDDEIEGVDILTEDVRDDEEKDSNSANEHRNDNDIYLDLSDSVTSENIEIGPSKAAKAAITRDDTFIDVKVNETINHADKESEEQHRLSYILADGENVSSLVTDVESVTDCTGKSADCQIKEVDNDRKECDKKHNESERQNEKERQKENEQCENSPKILLENTNKKNEIELKELKPVYESTAMKIKNDKLSPVIISNGFVDGNSTDTTPLTDDEVIQSDENVAENTSEKDDDNIISQNNKTNITLNCSQKSCPETDTILDVNGNNIDENDVLLNKKDETLTNGFLNNDDSKDDDGSNSLIKKKDAGKPLENDDAVIPNGKIRKDIDKSINKRNDLIANDKVQTMKIES